MKTTAIETKPCWWNDIRIWIAVVFMVRLWEVWNPPLDRLDSWRQSITAMVIRNLLEVDPNIFFPRIDFAGDLTGIVGMEFPIYNGVAAVLIWAMGISMGEELVARMLNMIITSVGVYYFHKSVKEFVSKDIAFPAAVLLLCSLWMLYSRKIMPDTFAAGVGLIGTYYGLRYALHGGEKELFKFTLWMSLAVLSKISVAFMLVYPPMLLLQKGALASKRLLALVSGIGCVLSLVTLWYFWWVPTLTAQFGFEHFFMGRPVSEGWTQIVQNLFPTIERFTKISLGYAGSVFLVLGMLYSVWRRDGILMWVFIGGLAAFMPFVIKSGFNFHHHNYYVIPFVPVLCVLAGYGASVLWRKGMFRLVVLIFSLFLLEQSARVIRDVNHKNGYLTILSKKMDEVSAPNDLIAIDSGDDPTPMYFSHRKGWLVHDNQLRSAAYRSDLENRGLRFVVLIKSPNKILSLQLGYPVVYQNEYFVIHKVVRDATPQA